MSIGGVEKNRTRPRSSQWNSDRTSAGIAAFAASLRWNTSMGRGALGLYTGAAGAGAGAGLGAG
jgi:hypothetical protein